MKNGLQHLTVNNKMTFYFNEKNKRRVLRFIDVLHYKTGFIKNQLFFSLKFFTVQN